VDAMRREVLAEREKRRAERAAATAAAAASEAAIDADLSHPACASIDAAIARLAAIPDRAVVVGAAATLARVVANVATAPEDARYRRLRLANEKIAAATTRADGGVALLEALGFVAIEEPESGDAFLALPESVRDVAPFQVAIRRFVSAGLLSRAAASALTTPKPPPRADPTKPPSNGRETRVFLPAVTCAAAVTELPDEYFKRDASEIQAEFKAAAERRENAGALMTKAWREKNMNKNGDDDDDDKADARPVTVRVRVPDGCVLEGKFMPREPIAVVREWVSGALREHFRAFALRCVLYAGPHTTALAW